MGMQLWIFIVKEEVIATTLVLQVVVQIILDFERIRGKYILGKPVHGTFLIGIGYGRKRLFTAFLLRQRTFYINTANITDNTPAAVICSLRVIR